LKFRYFDNYGVRHAHILSGLGQSVSSQQVDLCTKSEDMFSQVSLVKATLSATTIGEQRLSLGVQNDYDITLNWRGGAAQCNGQHTTHIIGCMLSIAPRCTTSPVQCDLPQSFWSRKLSRYSQYAAVVVAAMTRVPANRSAALAED